MLHKPGIAGQSACFASPTGDASSTSAIDPGVDTYSFESFSTPNGPVNHFMAVKSVILKQFVAVLERFSCKMPKKYSSIGVDLIQTTHCRDILHKLYSLPIYATDP